MKSTNRTRERTEPEPRWNFIGYQVRSLAKAKKDWENHHRRKIISSKLQTELLAAEVVIQSLPLHQFIVASLFDNLAFFDDQDDISVADSA